MRVVIAPQSLKGSLSAIEVGQAIVRGVRAVYSTAEIDMVPIADGGEGTVQALVDATGGQVIRQMVTGPLGESVHAFFGVLGDRKTAVIEMAACAGLPLVPVKRRDPRITTTYGVGELILAALERDCRHFIIAIGGSATNDGGAGMLQALGATLLDEQGVAIAPGGAALATLSHISLEHMDSRLRQCTIEVACDVTNPLCGPSGASTIYGPQKGATPMIVKQLDNALTHYASIIQRDLGFSIEHIPGTGSAGGMGAGLLAFLHATLRPGAEIVLEAVRLAQRLEGAHLVITAEGQIDKQTSYGKSVAAVARLAKHDNIPVLALAGSLGEHYQSVYELGIDALITLPSHPMTLAYAMENAATLTSDAIERALRILLLGSRIPFLP